MNDIALAFSLTLFAGLATSMGGLIAFTKWGQTLTGLAIALGFSAGVMVYVSFVEILPKGVEELLTVTTEQTAWTIGIASFFGGFIIAGLIDKLIPVHEVDEGTHRLNNKALLRTGLFTALAISIHNFPEGLATFLATIQEPTLGVAIAIAIAIHNIPEGLAVAIPILHATHNKTKAMTYTFLSGLAEPIGALVGYLVLRQFFTEWTFAILFTAVGGIMVYIAIDELLPSAHMHGDHHHVLYGFAAGMMVMAISLVLLI